MCYFKVIIWKQVHQGTESVDFLGQTNLIKPIKSEKKVKQLLHYSNSKR